MEIIKAIPTNIITGSLGTGKTTLIKNLLKSKPLHERWAVLVNEFGEIGIDGAFLAASFKTSKGVNNDKKSIFIREVPGGCMCCASGLPMQVALNQLITEAKPHRLLIEPTGLGHPKELLEVFSSEHYRNVIHLNTTFCLIDARNVTHPKWRSHQVFQDQLDVADIILTTKSDQYSEKDIVELSQYLRDIDVGDKQRKDFHDGPINDSLLNALSDASGYHERHNNKSSLLFQQTRLNDYLRNTSKATTTLPNKTLHNNGEIISRGNKGDDFYSRGWVWPAEYWFDYEAIIQSFDKINVVRLKAIMITKIGIFSINGQYGELDIKELDEAYESRLEIITETESMALLVDALFEDDLESLLS